MQTESEIGSFAPLQAIEGLEGLTLPDSISIEEGLPDREDEDNSFAAFLTRELSKPSGPISPESPLFEAAEENGAKKSELTDIALQNDQDIPFMSSFLVDLTHGIKNALASIKHISLLAIDKCNDEEFRRHSHTALTEDIKKIDSVLNSLLNYINISTPVIKTNTIYILLEEILEANEKQILDKKIKVFKKSEQNLPETFIHNEQVRFILNSVLQYAILSTPVHGAIGFSIKSVPAQNGGPINKSLPENGGGYIELIVGFTGHSKPANQSKEAPLISISPNGDAISLILQLVKDILLKNRGMMKFEVDKKAPKNFITLRFPIERRKLVYYEPISI